jgi:hypothetical protein
MVDERFAGDIISHLSDEIYQPWPREFGDRVPWNVVLAVQCLSEVRNISVGEQVAKKLLRTCWLLFKRTVTATSRRDARLPQFLDSALVPSAKVVGPNWPGRVQLCDWLRRDIEPKLSDFYEYSKVHACGTFVGSVGSGLPELRDLLVSLTQSEHIGGQCLGVHALSEFCQGQRDNFELLRHCFNASSNGIARGFALSYLAELWAGEEGEEVLALLRKGADDPEPYPREKALYGLSKYYTTDPDTLTLLLERAVNEPDGSTRAEAVRLAAEFFNAGARVLELLRERLITEKDSYVRASVVKAMVDFFRSDEETLPSLHDLAVNDTSPRQGATQFDNLYVRDVALVAIAKHWPNHPDTLPRLRERQQNDPVDWLRERAGRMADELERARA